MSELRVYHGFRSPYSRLGLQILLKAGLDAQVLPFLGPPEGVPFSNPTDNPLKRAYLRQDVPRMTLRLGLPIALPDPFDVDFAPANRALIAAGLAGLSLPFAAAVSEARWGQGKNISDIALLEACAEAAGWDRGAVQAAQEAPDVKAAVQAVREQTAADGVFGVPFAVRGEEKFWGHDRFLLLTEGKQA